MSEAAPSLVERMQRVAVRMGRVRAALTTPDERTLAEASDTLNEIAGELAELIADLRQGARRNNAAELAAAVRMRTEQEGLSGLLREGSDFLSGCLRLLTTHITGYTLEGRPAPLPEVGQISVKA